MNEPPRLKDLDPELAQVLGTLGERRASPGARRRLLIALFPVGATVLAASGSSAAAILGPKAWLVIYAVTATVAAGGGAVVLRSHSSPAPVVERAPVRVALATAPTTAAAIEAPPPPPIAPAAPLPPPVAPAAPLPEPRRTTARVVGSSTATPAPPPSPPSQPSPTVPSLAHELSLVDAAQQAVRRRDHARALLALYEYEAAFPSGALQDEARALRVAALAQAGRLSEARAAGERFLRTHPRSPLTARVAETLRATASSEVSR